MGNRRNHSHRRRKTRHARLLSKIGLARHRLKRAEQTPILFIDPAEPDTEISSISDQRKERTTNQQAHHDEQQISNTCRCCFRQSKFNDGSLLNMKQESFGCNNKKITIFDAYCAVNNFSNKNDASKIPSHEIKVCPLCMVQLESAHNFQELCRQTNEQMIIKYSTPKETNNLDLDGDNGLLCPMEDIESDLVAEKTTNNAMVITIHDGTIKKTTVVPPVFDGEKSVSIEKRKKKFICNKSYSTSGYLKVHLNKLHNHQDPLNSPSIITHSCTICAKTFVSLSALHIHDKSHLNMCVTCSRNFPTAKLLQDHKLTAHLETATLQTKTLQTAQNLWFGCGNCKRLFKTTDEALRQHQCSGTHRTGLTLT